jgi:hypothetical protein
VRENKNKSPDDFGENISGWHNILGWGDSDESVAPYVPTPMTVVKSMLEIAKAGPGDTLIDLGCGDGRILTMAIEEFNVDKAIGYELNKNLADTTLKNIYRKELGDKIEVINSNFMKADLSPATIVTLYLTTSGNAKLRPKFMKELRNGTRIISHDFPIMDWIISTFDNEAIKVGSHKIFLYNIPEAYKFKKETEKTLGKGWSRIKRILDRL